MNARLNPPGAFDMPKISTPLETRRKELAVSSKEQNMKRSTVFVALALTLAAGAAFAQAPAPAPGPGGDRGDQARRAPIEERFKAANKKGDGKLTKAEAEAGGLRRVAERFDEIDKDHKGYVTLDEVKAASSALRGAR